MRTRQRKAARPSAAFTLGSRLVQRAAKSPRNEAAPRIVEDVLRSSGQGLDGATRASLEPAFGHRIGDIRVHTDERAARSAQAVGARAYTVGRDIVFDAGQYAPHSAEGRRLLAHELAHVAQQAHAGPWTSGAPRISDDASLEAGAHAAAERGAPVAGGASAPAGALQRAPNRGAPWSPQRHVTAGVGFFDDGPWSTRNALGDYHTSDDSDRPLSQLSIPTLCIGQPLPLNFAFHVDTFAVPRPKPFDTGRVSMTLNYLTDGGETIPVTSQTSGAQYMTDGHALLTGMPVSVSFAPSEPGKLLISLAHTDPALNDVVVYSDEMPVVDCEPAPEPDQSKETNFYAVVLDPVNAPHDYELLGKQSDIMDESAKPSEKKDRGVITRIEEDQWGYFYRHVQNGQSRKIYIEDPNTK